MGAQPEQGPVASHSAEQLQGYDSETTTTPPEEVTEYHLNTVPSRLTRAQSRAGAAHSSDPEKQAEAAKEEVATPPNTRQISGLRWLLVCLSLYLSCFLYGLDTTIAADVQSAVVEQFGRVDQLAWIGAGFPLGSVSVILALGALYGSFNMKWVYVASVVAFNVGSLVCGAAPNMNAMIIGRIIAGMGGSGVFLGCLNYFPPLTTKEERALYINLTGFFWGIGSVLGPVVGGAFSVSGATWRWAFYINLVVGALIAPIVLLYLPPLHPVHGVSIRARIANLDFLGFVLAAAVWVLFTFGFTMAGAQWEWNDGRTIAILAVWGAVLIAYALQQRFAFLTTQDTRSFPVHLLKSGSQILLFIGTAANITSLFVIVYFIPIYFQFVHNDSALMAAARLLPFVFVSVISNLLAGHLLPKVNYYSLMFVVSGIFMTLGSALLTAYLDPETPQGMIYGFTIITAVGTGITLQIGYTAASLKVSEEDTTSAISLQNVAQIGGSVIALVISGQVFQSAAVANLERVLAGLGFSIEDIHGAVAGAQSELFAELSGDLRVQAVAAITQAMQRAFIPVIVAGAAVTVSGAFMKFERLFK